MLGNFSCLCCHLPTFFKINFFEKKSFRNTIIVSNILDPDQDRHSVGPNLGPNCLQMLSIRRQVTAREESLHNTAHRQASISGYAELDVNIILSVTDNCHT